MEPNKSSVTSDWFQELDDRQQKEVLFAESYADGWAHGTDGHHRLLLIARLARMLDDRNVPIEEKSDE